MKISWQGWFRRCILIASASILSGCGQLAPGTGEGWHGPNSEGYAYLRAELMLQFYDVLRPSQQQLAWHRKTEPNGGIYGDNKGFIPMELSAPEIDRRDLCARSGDPYCGGIAFGEDLLSHPDIQMAIRDWLINFCERFPKAVTNEQTKKYYIFSFRPKHAVYLRKFMGCDGVPKESRNIYIYAIRNFDAVFNGDEANTSAILKQAIIGEDVLKLNQ